MSNSQTIRIANGAGFLGDSLSAPHRLVEQTRVDYLTLEYLAELTLSILARQKEKDPQAGYAADFLEVLDSLRPALSRQTNLRVVTNAGGMNPRSCARAAAKILSSAGLGSLAIGVVSGDDLLPRLETLQQSGCDFSHLDTQQPLSTLSQGVVSANAYLGAAGIVEALTEGANLVITGRVADASLTVAPAVYEYSWPWDDYRRLAQASVAGHLIECGAQVTGGYATDWLAKNLDEIGYPIAEISPEAEVLITKPQGTDGEVNRQTVIEQLVYEIGDPQHYLTPDVEVDFTTVEVEDQGQDRVAVRGATGRAPSDSYKVSLAYRDGYTASGQLLVYGNDCVAKAWRCAEIAFNRLQLTGFEPERTHVELLGAGEGVPGLKKTKTSPLEVMLRISAADPRREAIELFTKEIAPLVTSGPAGLAGYTESRGRVRPVFAYWPALVSKQVIETSVEVYTADQWMHR